MITLSRMSEIHALLEDTRRRLRERMSDTSLDEIAVAAGVGEHWLRKFAQGRIPNPTVGNLGALRAYLQGGETAKAA